MYRHQFALTRVADPRLSRNKRSFGFAALAVIALSLGFCASSAEAAKLTKVKGDQVLVDLEGDGGQYAEGNRYLVMVDGKRKAVVEISKVKGQKAIGKVLKGTAYEGGTLAPLQGSSGGSAQASNDRAGKSSGRRKKRSRKNSSSLDGFSYGGVGGYSITNQTVSRSGESIAMTGSSLSLKAFGDYPLSGDIGAIGRVGFENFSVSGNSTALGGVKTTILYLDADLLFRYYLTEGSFKVFPLAGLGLHYPLSKTSGVLDVSRISITTIFFFGAGFNFMLSDSMYIHVTGEYGLFPPSSDVTTNLIAIRGGVGWML